MWHLEIPCPELLLSVWEAIPQIGIEGSLELEQLLSLERTSSNWGSMKQQDLAKATLNTIKTILSHLFHDAVLVFPERARANEDFSTEKKQPLLGRGKSWKRAAGCKLSLLWHVEHLLHSFQGSWNWIQV